MSTSYDTLIREFERTTMSGERSAAKYENFDYFEMLCSFTCTCMAPVKNLMKPVRLTAEEVVDRLHKLCQGEEKLMGVRFALKLGFFFKTDAVKGLMNVYAGA